MKYAVRASKTHGEIAFHKQLADIHQPSNEMKRSKIVFSPHFIYYTSINANVELQLELMHILAFARANLRRIAFVIMFHGAIEVENISTFFICILLFLGSLPPFSFAWRGRARARHCTAARAAHIPICHFAIWCLPGAVAAAFGFSLPRRKLCIQLGAFLRYITDTRQARRVRCELLFAQS